ncbi:hypothetical protein ACE0DR_12030 [Azotobacter sp. CWF10]
MLTRLARLSLRKSLPLVLGFFALIFTLLLTTLYLPRTIDKELHAWRSHTNQLLVLLQGTLSDHLRHGRQAELETTLADFASLQGIRWAMVADPQLRVLATTRLGLAPGTSASPPSRCRPRWPAGIPPGWSRPAGAIWPFSPRPAPPAQRGKRQGAAGRSGFQPAARPDPLRGLALPRPDPRAAVAARRVSQPPLPQPDHPAPGAHRPGGPALRRRSGAAAGGGRGP